MKHTKIIEAAGRRAEKAGAHRALSRLNSITDSPEYSEPGYSTNHPVILFGNWNGFTQWDEASRSFLPVEPDNGIWTKAVALLEKCAELEWEDEWTTCDECAKAIRTSPDCYGWTPAYHNGEDGIVCHECVPKMADSILEDHVCNHRKALMPSLGINPAEHGFAKVDQDFEHGFHPGQDASPEKIAAALAKRGVTRWLFTIDSVGQFDVNFSAWVDSAEADKVTALDDHEVNGPSVSGAMERGLKEASVKMAELQGEGVRYASIGMDGAKVRLVPPAEFAEGIRD